MGKRNPQGMVIETGDTKIVIFGAIVGIGGLGLIAAVVVLASSIALAIQVLAWCVGAAAICLSIGKAVQYSKLGDAAKIAAKAHMIAAREQWRELPPGRDRV